VLNEDPSDWSTERHSSRLDLLGVGVERLTNEYESLRFRTLNGSRLINMTSSSEEVAKKEQRLIVSEDQLVGSCEGKLIWDGATWHFGAKNPEECARSVEFSRLGKNTKEMFERHMK
jgi:hypothetical protein